MNELRLAFGGYFRDPVQIGPVLQLLEPMLLRAGSAVDVIPGISVGDEDIAKVIHRQTKERGAEGVDGLNQLVSLGIEDEQIAIRNLGVLDNIHGETNGVESRGKLLGFEGDEFPVNLFLFAPGELCLVIGFKWEDVEFAIIDGNRSRLLRRDFQVIHDPARSDIDHRDLVA